MAQQSSSTDITATRAAVISAGAAVVSTLLFIVAIVQSCGSNRIAKEANDIARTAEAHNQTQDAQQLTAHVEAKTFVARSLDLQAEEDKSFWVTTQLAPHIVKTPYWLSQRATYNVEAQKGYLFVFVINNGPGMVYRLRFSGMHWYPKQGFQPPTGILMEGDLGILRSEHFYALLVNVLTPINSDMPWRQESFDIATAEYESVYFDVAFQDALEADSHLPILLGRNPALGEIPTPGPAMIWP
jgi:hypothetical protein